MQSLKEIEEAVSNLEGADFDRFRTWFETFEAERFDDKIERDAEAGKLDRRAEQALADFRQVRLK